MKVRLDYVSNSSSASFLIRLPKPIGKYEKDEFLSLFKTRDMVYGEDEGECYAGVKKNEYYFVDLFNDEGYMYWGTPFKLDDGQFLYNVSIHDGIVELYDAVMMEAKVNKELIPYWKYDS